MKEFGPKDSKDTARDADKFLRGQRSQKEDAVDGHLSALEDPDISQDLCHAYFSALRCLARDLGTEVREKIRFEVLVRMWIGKKITEIPLENVVLIRQFIEDLDQKVQ